MDLTISSDGYLFLNCGKTYTMKWPIVTMSTRLVQGEVHSHCCGTTTPIHATFPPCETEALHPSHNTCPAPARPGPCHSTSCPLGRPTLGTSRTCSHSACPFVTGSFTQVMSSRFVCAGARVGTSFLPKAEQYSPAYNHAPFLRSPAGGRLGGEHLLAAGSHAAVNVAVQRSLSPCSEFLAFLRAV